MTLDPTTVARSGAVPTPWAVPSGRLEPQTEAFADIVTRATERLELLGLGSGSGGWIGEAPMQARRRAREERAPLVGAVVA